MPALSGQPEALGDRVALGLLVPSEVTRPGQREKSRGPGGGATAQRQHTFQPAPALEPQPGRPPQPIACLVLLASRTVMM